jgi:four helix bundle protein
LEVGGDIKMSFRFLNFKVYKDSLELHLKIVRLTRKFKIEFYYLKDQIRRSSLSIVLNIAEGSAKTSDRDFNRYLENAMGSANETAAALNVAFSEKLVSDESYKELIALCENVVNQLGGFSKKLKLGG